jgi:transposase
MVAVRTRGLRMLQVDPELEALRMLVDRREALSRRRVQTVDRLQALLAELLPGQAKKDLTTGQAKTMLASVRPRDIAGKTRRRIAVEELAELVAVEAKMKQATAELKAMVLARGSHLMDLRGIGPVVAARVLADVGDVARFADRNRFASWTGTAPLDASSGEHARHWLSRAGNRRVNHMIHIAVISQLRVDSEGRPVGETIDFASAQAMGHSRQARSSVGPCRPPPRGRLSRNTRRGTARNAAT